MGNLLGALLAVVLAGAFQALATMAFWNEILAPWLGAKDMTWSVVFAIFGLHILWSSSSRSDEESGGMSRVIARVLLVVIMLVVAQATA